MQTFCYPGREEESFAERSMQLYKQMKTKTSQSKPPEEKAMLQASQVFYSSRVNEIIISDFFLIMVGLLTKNKEVRLLWFTGLISFLYFHSS